MSIPQFLQLLFLTTTILNSQVLSQISTPCTTPVTNMFTPCMNFLTNSSGSGNSPTTDCCNALKGLTGTGFDCLCLLLTASVPFNLPINRTIAASLPRACNMPGVPVQCKGAAGAPLAAPGPAGFAPNTSPNSAGSGSVFPGSVTPTSSPTTDDDDDSNNTPTVRPALTPSAAATQATSFSYVFVVMAVGALAIKYH